MPIRQTQSYLRSLFDKHGISPQHRLGQNFLIDLNIHELIVATAEVGANDVILEVGSGTGALTSLMAERGAVVVAVDVDPAMVMLTTEAVAGLSRVRVVHRDALAGKHRLDSVVVESVREEMAARSDTHLKLVANLPYQVATPLIANLLVHAELCPELMVVTIQKELAERFCAKPSTPAYGAVSVLIQSIAEVSIVRLLPPTVFWPRPQVESAVVMIRPNDVKRAAVGDVTWFHEVVRRLFLHRRKCIRHVLASGWFSESSKAEVDHWLEQYGISGERRAEALGIAEFLELTKALRERGSGAASEPENDRAELETKTKREFEEQN